MRVPPARCDVSPVCTPIRGTLDVAQKWAVGTECNAWAMLLCVQARRSLEAFWGHLV